MEIQYCTRLRFVPREAFILTVLLLIFLTTLDKCVTLLSPDNYK